MTVEEISWAYSLQARAITFPPEHSGKVVARGLLQIEEA
jgi:hypothetical protein